MHFKSKTLTFTVVKPFILGTKATIDALLLIPGEFFKSLPDQLSDLEQYCVEQPSDSMKDNFKHDIYKRYLHTLSEHISSRFPDVNLEGFDIFNPRSIPQQLSLQTFHGFNMLDKHITHGSRGMVHS